MTEPRLIPDDEPADAQRCTGRAEDAASARSATC